MHIKKTLYSILMTARTSLQTSWNRMLCCLIVFLMVFGFIWYCLRYAIPEEMALRNIVVSAAESHFGQKEADGTHKEIIDFYNMQQYLPRGYEVSYTDSWCAVFGSVIALELGLTEMIPVECSCEQQIQLFAAVDQWIETDWYLPKPGDYIFYDWNYATKKDSRGWSDHVGIVVKTIGPVIQVIEGNKEDSVAYRYLFLNDPTIRGFGVPDYGHFCFSYE